MERGQQDEQLMLIRELCDLHDIIVACEVIQEYKQAHPDCVDVYVEEINLFFTFADAAGVKSSVEAIARLAPGSAADLFGQAVVEADKDRKTAIQMLDLAIALEPTFERAWYMRGLLNMREENYAAAVRDFDQAIAMNPRHERAVLYAAESKVKIGNWAGAILDLSYYLQLPEIYEEEYAYRMMAFCSTNLADALSERQARQASDKFLDDLF